MRKIKLLFLSFLFSLNTAHANDQAFKDKAQQLLDQHYQQYKELEYFSGAALSIYVPKHPIDNHYIGQVSHEKQSEKINANTLFQIGSITKSFTAAIVLQAEKQGKLRLNQTINDWLPHYSKWSTVKIDALLNMTSGLPNYSETPLWNAAEYNDPNHRWTNEELIEFVYPKNPFSPPLKSGYFYTNTNYILTDLIIEKATKQSFPELMNHLIQSAKLSNTFYPIPIMEKAVQERMAHGYSYNQYDNPALIGVDLSNNNLTWAAAAGGAVSNTEEIIKWVKAIFMDDTLLDAKQKQKLERLVSINSGNPIATTSEKDPQGFGLGVAQMHTKEINRFWFYEGETLGFRAIYLYVPCNNVIVASVFNSATNAENDHAKELMKKAYKLVLTTYPSLHC